MTTTADLHCSAYRASAADPTLTTTLPRRGWEAVRSRALVLRYTRPPFRGDNLDDETLAWLDAMYRAQFRPPGGG